jgi:GDPmannose 4,6-dehydratase
MELDIIKVKTRYIYNMYAAIVTGPDGQDGTYMCELLQEKGYHLVKFRGDVGNYDEVYTVIQSCVDFECIEVYNLAAKVHASSPTDTFHVNTMGILNIMEAVKNTENKSRYKIFQASSSEIFANHWETPQTEYSMRVPGNIYGISKVSADSMVRYYRETHDLHVCSGILYNHESPRRKGIYVTQKIIKGLQSGECFQIGNLESRRDWGHAKDYVKAMWLMLQQSLPEDFIIATGKTYSVREFIEIVVGKLNKTITWSGQGKYEVGKIDDKVVVEVSEKFYRSDNKTLLVGNAKRIEKLGWVREYDIDSLIEEMLHPFQEKFQVSNT